MHRNQGVEDLALAAATVRDGQHQQEGLFGVQLGLFTEGRVLEGVLPALGQPPLTPADPVGVGDPLAGVRVADGVVEFADPAAEDGPGHEIAVFLPLHQLPVPVDQHDVVVSGWRLGQGQAAGGDGDDGREQQSRRPEGQAPGPARGWNESPEHGCLLSPV